ncbi:pilin, partial [Patescibacteria group bacterium]|nr:pilin [Patescibacteria group bacterium]
MKYFKKFSIIISIAIFLMPGFVFAEVNPDLKDDLYVKLQIPLPFVATDCKLPDGSPAVCDMTDYIEGIYRLLIGTGALFAVVMIIIAGYQWIFAGGSPDKINAAKKRIFGAVIGLILALLSFIILNTITPRLVSLRLPDVEPVSGLDFVIGETCQNSERIIGLEKILKFSEGDLPVIGENAIEATTRDKA